MSEMSEAGRARLNLTHALQNSPVSYDKTIAVRVDIRTATREQRNASALHERHARAGFGRMAKWLGCAVPYLAWVHSTEPSVFNAQLQRLAQVRPKEFEAVSRELAKRTVIAAAKRKANAAARRRKAKK